MKKVAIYPGTFDPITFGHIDVIKKALKLFDKIVVAVSDGENKDYLFDAEERLEIVRTTYPSQVHNLLEWLCPPMIKITPLKSIYRLFIGSY